MGKLLIVAYTYPPLATVGAIRPLTLAREASRQGWDVNVLSVEADYAIPRDYSVRSPVKATRAIRVPFSYFTRWLKYPLKGKGILWSFMDYQYDWVPTAVAAGARLHNKWPFDVIWATAPPFSSLRVGVKLAERYGIPSIADLRDPFINNITRDFLHPWIKEFWSRYYHKLLSHFDRRIIVDDCIIEELRGLSYSLVRNGYDENEFLGQAPDKFQKFTVGFVGSVYKELNIEPLFLAFKNLPEEIRMNSMLLFVGKGSALAANYAKKHHIEQFEARPIVPRSEAIDIMKRCHVLVWFGANAVGTKIYEYAQTGAMSLQIYDSDDQHSYRFAEEYGLSHNVRADRIDEISALLLEAYRRNHYDYTKHLKRFTREAAAKDILRIIEEVVK
ncbi:MAG: hypothetical protein EAX95_13590 [Candidatus Thorarchaeota archaeon]|nr:hypothetical protein [Candidatus Thorarchaeota archaeon]